MGDQVMKIHPGSVVAQTPHSAIIYDELVRMYFHSKIGADADSTPLDSHSPNLCTRGFSCN